MGITLEWTKARDLDLHAFFTTTDGKTGHVYFDFSGMANAFPYIVRIRTQSADRFASSARLNSHPKCG